MCHLDTKGVGMLINREWAMPNSKTFEIKPIKQFIHKNIFGEKIIDPFANNNKIATITNDLDTQYDTDYHMDAIEFLKQFEDNSIDFILFDPPYSTRQVSECYKNLTLQIYYKPMIYFLYKSY